MKTIPKLKKKNITNIDPGSLTAALHCDKLSPDTSLRGDFTAATKANDTIQDMIDKQLQAAKKLLEK